jgi:hypothetical protein
MIWAMTMFWVQVYMQQRKGRWESNINFWFPFMYSQKWTVRPPYFQNRVIMFCLPIPTLIYLWEIGCLFCCSEMYVDRSWEYINRSRTHECRNWDWGLAIPLLGTHKLNFRYSVLYTSKMELQKLVAEKCLRRKNCRFKLLSRHKSRIPPPLFLLPS